MREACKKSIYLILALLLAAMVTVMPLAADDVWASEGSASIDAASQVTKGDTFTVTVRYSGDNLGRVRGMMKYKTSVLEYISGGSSEGNGVAVELKGSSDGGDITFSVKFKAVGKGQTKLTLRTSDMYDMDEMDMGNPAASTAVKVNAPAPAEQQTDDQDDDSDKDDQDDDQDDGDMDGDDQEDVDGTDTDDPDDSEDIDTDDQDEDAGQTGVSDRTKIIAIIVAAAVAILAVNLMILRSRRKNR